MKKMNFTQMESLLGGLCIDRPDPGQETSGISCPGMCMASQIVFANTGHGLGSDSLLCFV